MKKFSLLIFLLLFVLFGCAAVEDCVYINDYKIDIIDIASDSNESYIGGAEVDYSYSANHFEKTINSSKDYTYDFDALGNVTSVEDTSSNLLTVDCKIFSYGTLSVNITDPISTVNVNQSDTWSNPYTPPV